MATKKQCALCGLSSTELQPCGHALHAECRRQLGVFKLRCVACIPPGSLESKYAANCQLFIMYLDKNEKWGDYQNRALAPCRKLAAVLKGFEALAHYPQAACALGRMHHYGHGVVGNRAKALELFKRAGDYGPAKQAVGVLHSETGNCAEAIEAYTAAIELGEGREAYLNRGSMYLALGEEQPAFLDFMKTLELWPNDARAIANLGAWNLAFRPGTQDAFLLLSKAVHLDPTLGNASTTLAKLHLSKGDAVSVAESERLLRGVSPATVASLTTLASLLVHKYTFGKGDSSLLLEASIHAAAAANMDPNSPDPYCSLADIYQAENKPDKAIETYRSLLKKFDHYSTTINLAVLLSTPEYDQEVVDLYRKAISLQPKNTDAFGMFGIYLSTTERFREARDVLEDGLRVDPRHPDLLCYHAVLLAHQEPGDAARFVKLFSDVLAINPDHSLANYHLAKLTADPAASLAFMVRAAKNDPCNAELWVLVGSKHFLSGDGVGPLMSAVAAFQRAFKLRPGCPKIANHISDCWYVIGLRHKAAGDDRRALQAFFKVDMDCKSYPQAAEEIAKFKAA